MGGEARGLEKLNRPPWWMRIVCVVIGLAAWFETQALIGARPPLPEATARVAGTLLTDSDGLLQLTARTNDFLNAHPSGGNALLISSSVLIDFLGIFLLVWSVVGPSIRPFLGLLILFGLR